MVCIAQNDLGPCFGQPSGDNTFNSPRWPGTILRISFEGYNRSIHASGDKILEEVNLSKIRRIFLVFPRHTTFTKLLWQSWIIADFSLSDFGKRLFKVYNRKLFWNCFKLDFKIKSLYFSNTVLEIFMDFSVEEAGVFTAEFVEFPLTPKIFSSFDSGKRSLSPSAWRRLCDEAGALVTLCPSAIYNCAIKFVFLKIVSRKFDDFKIKCFSDSHQSSPCDWGRYMRHWNYSFKLFSKIWRIFLNSIFGWLLVLTPPTNKIKIIVPKLPSTPPDGKNLDIPKTELGNFSLFLV